MEEELSTDDSGTVAAEQEAAVSAESNAVPVQFIISGKRYETTVFVIPSVTMFCCVFFWKLRVTMGSTISAVSAQHEQSVEHVNNDLQHIMTEWMPQARVYCRYIDCFLCIVPLKSCRMRLKSGIDCDEVYPGIIIGTGPTVKNLKYLVKLEVTHILNTAENDVHISPARYAKEGIMYKGIGRMPDLPQSDIYQHFQESAEFIDRALSFTHGLVRGQDWTFLVPKMEAKFILSLYRVTMVV